MYGQTGSGKTFTIMGSKLHNSKPDQLHKKPPLPYESLERTPSSNYKSMKTPNKINSASNIANVQIDLNSLMSETEKYEVESEKGPKKLPIEQFPSYFFDNSEANPMKNFRNTNDCLFNEDENLEGVLLLALKDMFSEMEKQIDKKFFIRCSYLEIYTDLVYDLLKDQDHLFETLTIGEDLNVILF